MAKKSITAVGKIAKRVEYAECYILSSQPMRCPLCGVEIPANTEHTCRKEQ